LQRFREIDGHKFCRPVPHRDKKQVAARSQPQKRSVKGRHFSKVRTGVGVDHGQGSVGGSQHDGAVPRNHACRILAIGHKRPSDGAGPYIDRVQGAREVSHVQCRAVGEGRSADWRIGFVPPKLSAAASLECEHRPRQRSNQDRPDTGRRYREYGLSCRESVKLKSPALAAGERIDREEHPLNRPEIDVGFGNDRRSLDGGARAKPPSLLAGLNVQGNQGTIVATDVENSDNDGRRSANGPRRRVLPYGLTSREVQRCDGAGLIGDKYCISTDCRRLDDWADAGIRPALRPGRRVESPHRPIAAAGEDNAGRHCGSSKCVVRRNRPRNICRRRIACGCCSGLESCGRGNHGHRKDNRAEASNGRYIHAAGPSAIRASLARLCRQHQRGAPAKAVTASAGAAYQRQ
jgi:hypothetical protein